MSQTTNGPTADQREPSVDPRVQRTQHAVLDAAADLLVEAGPSAVTVDAIVARSGVAKSTMYRHWSSRDEILVDVIERAKPDLVAPDEALGFEAALRAVIAQMVIEFSEPTWLRIFPSLIQLKMHEPSFRDLERELRHQHEDVVLEVLRRGAAEGRITAADVPTDDIAQLLGPFVYYALSTPEAITDEFGRHVVDRFLAGPTG